MIRISQFIAMNQFAGVFFHMDSREIDAHVAPVLGCEMNASPRADGLFVLTDLISLQLL